jgi:hypothetical protein
MTWTLTHGFYTTIGGFAIDGSKAERPFLPKGQEHVTFTQVALGSSYGSGTWMNSKIYQLGTRAKLAASLKFL